MNVQLKLYKPKNIRCEVTLTGPLSDFEALLRQLEGNDIWPASNLAYALKQAVDAANKIFHGMDQEKNDG